jgi:DNA-binding IscR family transcriptional regulator
MQGCFYTPDKFSTIYIDRSFSCNYDGYRKKLGGSRLSISSRFAVAVHIISLLEYNKDGRNTSEFIAGSVNTNPVVIRRIMGMLNKAGLVLTSPGVAGASLARPVDEISLLDVYRAVLADSQEDLFSIHQETNPNCMVGRNIQAALESVLTQVQSAMEKKLSTFTMRQIVSEIEHQNKIKKEGKRI